MKYDKSSIKPPFPFYKVPLSNKSPSLISSLAFGQVVRHSGLVEVLKSTKEMLQNTLEKDGRSKQHFVFMEANVYLFQSVSRETWS